MWGNNRIGAMGVMRSEIAKLKRLKRSGKTRGVMIPALDPYLESDFQLFGDSGSGFGSNIKVKL